MLIFLFRYFSTSAHKMMVRRKTNARASSPQLNNGIYSLITRKLTPNRAIGVPQSYRSLAIRRNIERFPRFTNNFQPTLVRRVAGGC